MLLLIVSPRGDRAMSEMSDALSRGSQVQFYRAVMLPWRGLAGFGRGLGRAENADFGLLSAALRYSEAEDLQLRNIE